ncbi:zinc knuckle [Opisthorchis viverrini]|uniref:Zinc knuckle n=1 Tax=Opisthorchis viverrini TaxID=6198 RepID=A0A1S8XAH6_OPIVI|nr:zinc knuckle [Opisthorchis viverrini]
MKADNDVEAARLMHTLSCSAHESRADDESISAPSRVAIYAEECRRQHELGLSYREPKFDANNVSVATTSTSAEIPVWDDPTKGYLLGRHSPKRNSEGCMASNHTLAPLTSMDLPRVELTKFDGSSHDYLKSIRQFGFYVESRTTEGGQRLLCLLHYCRGRAREAIEECNDLRNFTNIRARISNSRFGTIADQTNKCRAAQTTLPKQPVKRQHSFVNAVFKTPESCPLCREPHPLTDCVKFAEFDCNKRWDVAKGCKVCFRCLKTGHMTRACNTERKCGANECKARHHYLPHTTSDVSRSVQGICNAANARQGSTAGTWLSESCVENLEIGSLLDSIWVNIEKAFVVPSIMLSVNVESRVALARRYAHLDDLPITDVPRTLLTFMSEVGRIVNNRPIVAPRSDVRDKLALSPNMLLLLEENTGIPSHCSYAEKFTRKWKHGTI